MLMERVVGGTTGIAFTSSFPSLHSGGSTTTTNPVATYTSVNNNPSSSMTISNNIISNSNSSSSSIIGHNSSNPSSHGGRVYLEVQSYSPPEAFGIVESGVFRCNGLKPGSFAFIKTLKLKSIIYLSAEQPLKSTKLFLENHDIRISYLGLKVWKPDASWKPVSDELIKEGLEFILDVNNHPVMIMCTSGVQETGVLVGCLRRLQQWNMTSILDEYRRYAGARARYDNEMFLELFDIDLVTLPAHLPLWFISQMKMLEQEAEEIKKIRAATLALLPHTPTPSVGSATSSAPTTPTPLSTSSTTTALTGGGSAIASGATTPTAASSFSSLPSAPASRSSPPVLPPIAVSSISSCSSTPSGMPPPKAKIPKEKDKKKDSKDGSEKPVKNKDSKKKDKEKDRDKEKDITPETPRFQPRLDVPPQYKKYEYLVHRSPLVSENVVINAKKSIIDDDDD